MSSPRYENTLYTFHIFLLVAPPALAPHPMMQPNPEAPTAYQSRLLYCLLISAMWFKQFGEELDESS